MQTQILRQLDLAHIWHPCTQMSDHENIPLIPIKRAKGMYLYDFDDRSYMDCVSSWWVNLFGHCNETISYAVKKQLDNLEHVILAGFTHEPIITLSQRLCSLLPPMLTKCFYADNGSSCIEVALKMSFHSFRNRGQERKYFLALNNAYHGETLGALSVGDVSLYKQTYSPLLLQCLHTPVPHNPYEYSNEIESLKQILKQYGKQICAFILEPLIQCAGNMNMYGKDYIKKAVELCREYEIQIIFDEIAVGNTFYAPYKDIQKAFLHSHSYTGNTLACAAANAVLDIFETNNVIEQNIALSSFIATQFKSLTANPKVANMRYCGMIFAFDVITDRERAGLFVFMEGLKSGLLLRPLGNTIYFMPPYIITHNEICYVVENLKTILEIV